nr:nucleotide-binding alpha-beta plait domain-containing protein [Tanacetum cinerariifolium]
MGDSRWTEVRRKNRTPANQMELPSIQDSMGDSRWTEVRRKNRTLANQMGKIRSKEDDVARLSTSVFISNIPDFVMAKDLFYACSQYGHVVDSFIPFKRDKNECLNDKDFALSLFGRVKEFASMANLKVAIGNEGFEEIRNKYMGEQWVLLEFQSNRMGGSGGVPLKLWPSNTFRRIAAKWGKLLDEEFKIIHRGKSYWIRADETVGWVPDFTDEDEDEEVNYTYSSDGSDIQRQDVDKVPDAEMNADNNADVDLVQETDFEDAAMRNNQDNGAKHEAPIDKSEDPFGLYSLLNKVNRNKPNSKTSIKFPPGFTPPVDKEEVMFEDTGANPKSGASELKVCKENINDDASCNQVNMNFKDEEKGSLNSGHFKKSGCPRTDGSILGVLEEVVKVGQVMGCNMDGCISNIGEIISSKGVDEVYR